MKTYVAPKLLMHQTVEFGTTHISNSWFYKWCQGLGFRPFICWIFCPPDMPRGPRGPHGPSGPGGPGKGRG